MALHLKSDFRGTLGEELGLWVQDKKLGDLSFRQLQNRYIINKIYWKIDFSKRVPKGLNTFA